MSFDYKKYPILGYRMQKDLHSFYKTKIDSLAKQRNKRSIERFSKSDTFRVILSMGILEFEKQLKDLK